METPKNDSLHPFYKNFIVHCFKNMKSIAVSDNETTTKLLGAGLIVQGSSFDLPRLSPLGRQSAETWINEGITGDAPISKEMFFRLHDALQASVSASDKALLNAAIAYDRAKEAREKAQEAYDRYYKVFGNHIRIENYPSEND